MKWVEKYSFRRAYEENEEGTSLYHSPHASYTRHPLSDLFFRVDAIKIRL
jgi:hypothetical protein